MTGSGRSRAHALAVLLLGAATACGDRVDLDTPAVIAAGNAHRPTVAIDESGAHAYVAWISGDTIHDVMLARTGTGGAFSAPVRVNSVPGDAAPHAQAPAQVAVGPEGNVYVVWQNNTVVPGRRFPASDLRLARSTDGGRTFEPTIFVNDDAGGPPTSHTFHDIAVDADGTVYVSWIDGRDRADDGGAEHAGHGGAVSNGSATHATDADAAAAAADGPAIRIARSTDGGRSFEPGVVVADRACPCCRTALAVHGSQLYLAWRDVGPGSIRDVVVARSDDSGRTWSQSRAVHEDGWRIDGCPHAGPALAATADGRIHVAWYTGAPDRPGIYYATADSTLTFDAPRGLLTGAWVPPSLVALAETGGGVIAVWDDRRMNEPVIRVALPDARDAAAQTEGLSPAIASAGGEHIVAWLRNDSIFAHRWSPQ